MKYSSRSVGSITCLYSQIISNVSFTTLFKQFPFYFLLYQKYKRAIASKFIGEDTKSHLNKQKFSEHNAILVQIKLQIGSLENCCAFILITVLAKKLIFCILLVIFMYILIKSLLLLLLLQ